MSVTQASNQPFHLNINSLSSLLHVKIKPEARNAEVWDALTGDVITSLDFNTLTYVLWANKSQFVLFMFMLC